MKKVEITPISRDYLHFRNTKIQNIGAKGKSVNTY